MAHGRFAMRVLLEGSIEGRFGAAAAAFVIIDLPAFRCGRCPRAARTIAGRGPGTGLRRVRATADRGGVR